MNPHLSIKLILLREFLNESVRITENMTIYNKILEQLNETTIEWYKEGKADGN